jgi:arsenate reductase
MGDAFTIYHNPACGTSRNTLALLRESGEAVTVVEYLKEVPSKDVVQSVMARAGLNVRDVLRKKGTPYKELGLDDKNLSDEALLDAIQTHPILLNRPIVVSNRGVALCRPSDVVVDLLPPDFHSSLVKEEGAPFLRDQPIAGDDPALRAALTAAKLPTDDLNEVGRSFFAYSTLAGDAAGFAGYELYGEQVLLRSLVVPEAQRSQRIGRNVVPLLLYRAFRAGARQAWVLTTTAEPFFSKIGFKVTERNAAPPSILSTRQAKDLCPSTAILLSRSLGF